MEIKEVPLKKQNETKDEAVFELLDELITSGRISKEYKISDKLCITLQTLTTDELLEAESISLANSDIIPKDVVQRARVVNILVYSTVSLNSTKILSDDQAKQRENRRILRDKYMDFPPVLVERLYSFYMELVQEVSSKLLKDLESNLVNF